MAKQNFVFVNSEKHRRAIEISKLLLRNPKNQEEQDIKERFAPLVEAGVKKGEDVVLFLYKTLGGLIRTPEQEEKATKRKAALKKKGTKADKEEEESDEDAVDDDEDEDEKDADEDDE